MRSLVAGGALLLAILVPRLAHAEMLHTRLHVFGMD